ncbi:MAG: hypothetical protein ACFE8P_15580 [Promethearchaeota archaeon]
MGVGAGFGVSFLLKNDSITPILSLNPVYGDVSLSERKPCIIRDTIEGSIYIDIDIPSDDLPLCLTEDYINENWNFYAEVSGYDLENTLIRFIQKGEMWIWIWVTWNITHSDPCGKDYYNATFIINEFYILKPYGFGSNRWPDGAEPLIPTNSEFIPGKEIYINETHYLKGCNDPLQHFTLEGKSTVKNTEKGWIIVDYNIPDPLDLCITSEDLEDWNATIWVLGYHPINGSIEIWQKDEYLGKVLVDWYWNPEYSKKCHYNVYTATFTMEEGVDYITLYSNQWPDGAIPDSYEDTIPGKDVILCPVNLYKGCDEKEQMFLKIMAHEIRIPGVPNSY